MALNILAYPDLGSWLHWQQTGMPNRPAHLLRALQKRSEVRRILVVEPPFPLLKSLVNRDRYRLERKAIVWSRFGAAVLEVEDKIHVLEVPAVPPSRCRILSPITRLYRDWTTEAAVKALGMRPLVLLFGVPFNHELVGRFGEVLSVFDDTGANWLTFCEPIDKLRVQQAYQRVCEKADVILVATDFMRRFLNRPQGAVELIPQGVDCSAFQKSSSSAAPADLQQLPHPWLGYVGALGERLDLSILEALADAFPTGSLVLVGPMSAAENYFVRLRDRKNVHFLGRRNYGEVPLYVNAFDVFVIPHKVTDETLSQRSMKFYERLATGKPTVSTPVPPAPEFGKLSYVAASPESFVAATRQALQEDGSSISFIRREAAAKESWDNRADRILEIILKQLGESHALRE